MTARQQVNDGAVAVLLARAIAVCAVVALGYFVVAFGNLLILRHSVGLEEAGLRAQILRLESEGRVLADREAELGTDAAIERLAREQLGMVRPGDTPVRIARPRPTPTFVAKAQPTPTPISLADEVKRTLIGPGR